MSTRRIECKGAAFMERVFAKMQEMYTHVNFLVMTENSSL